MRCAQYMGALKNSLLPDQLTLQTDGRTDGRTYRQTDDRQLQDHALHYSASCSNNVYNNDNSPTYLLTYLLNPLIQFILLG